MAQVQLMADLRLEGQDRLICRHRRHHKLMNGGGGDGGGTHQDAWREIVSPFPLGIVNF